MVAADASKQILAKTEDPLLRDCYRRALIRLVQAGDRLPSSLTITVQPTRHLLGNGAFADVYRGSAGRTHVALKVPRTLVKLPEDVIARRVRYG